MPELPEVETIRRGLAPALEQRSLIRMDIHEPRLRWPVPLELLDTLPTQRLHTLERRGKYLLFNFDHGTLLLHLGMSGRLQLLQSPHLVRAKHDHLEFYFEGGWCLRLNDPRRFGACLWTQAPATEHPLLMSLGVEPLTDAFDAAYLQRQLNKRRTPIKTTIMNGRILVGVGNIYANEALFEAGIHPKRPAHELAEREIEQLTQAIKTVLAAAIEAGGTTLQDYRQSDGALGYFTTKLQVYGRNSQPCHRCQHPLTEIRLNQRTTVYCERCQV